MIEKKIGTRKVPQTITVEEAYEYEELATTEEVFEVPVVNLVQKETVVEETYTETEEVYTRAPPRRQLARSQIVALASCSHQCLRWCACASACARVRVRAQASDLSLPLLA